MEPTPYIVPRALYLLHDPGLHADLYFTFLNNSQPWGSDAEIGSVPVLLDPSLSRGRRVANVFTLLWKILRGDYTVAHLAGWGHWVVRLVILCCKLRGVPFSVESDSPLRPDLQTPRERLKSLLYPIWMRWITYAIPGGSRQATYFRYYKVPDDKILISHMTVDTDKIRKISSPSKRDFRINRGIPEHQVLFIFVGRLLELKGLDTVLKAFERLQASEPSIALVVVGDGPERAKLEAAAARYPGRIWLVGREGSEGVIGWLRAADVFVLASRDEHWGLVVNEAMTCGLPVLVSDACGCVDDLVVSGRNGVVFPVDNADKLAESMLKLAVDPELRRRMGSESESMIRPWTIERQAETIRMALVKMSYKK
jgi:glycosyltransferase involved in cell wall biosynthesis